MVQYVLRRLLVAVPMLLGAMSIVFFAMRVLPGDPCVAMTMIMLRMGADPELSRTAPPDGWKRLTIS